ncbi:HIRAN domain-containing protein [Fictibacillus sp. WQ 8-8]|uniref:HIRAN domain-containing protein n=1 Tax=Fictibacillus sp. WQ 8-8 TaxID=2938788 RepID=UPI00210E666C|nr:HIRAN domain-containing protein [Fictibacillus sp. WQ 8-8]MCQ6264498.1 HIRAN domain-containing protein [Fictibacillus sp. WQ 8-8]
MEYQIIDVSSWEKDELDKGPGVGERQKEWIKDPITNRVAMFKIPRENRGEHWAEKLCSEIANILEFQCAEVEIAVRNGVIGCLSYFFLEEKVGFSHFDGGKFFPFDYDDEKNIGYNIQLIDQVLSPYNLFKDFLFIVVFDALVANGDRHQDNWGITRHDKKDEIAISPMYDNSACLGRELSEEKVRDYLHSQGDFLRYIFRSKSKIGWDSVKKEYHFSLVKKLCYIFPNEVKSLIDKLKRLSDNEIKKLVEKIPSSIITDEHKLFIIKYLKKRRDIIIRIGDNMGKKVDKLLLIWKDSESRQRFTVGELSYSEEDETYRFQYKNPQLDDALSHGFKDYPNFPDLNKQYEIKDTLFKSIKSRLPKQKRPDYQEILDRYGLDPDCTELELLEATRGRIATDNFEFVKAITYSPGEPFNITFDLAAARHYKFQDVADKLNIGDPIKLELDTENIYDKYAVSVLTTSGEKIGFIPKYYSYEVHKLLKENHNYKAVLIELDSTNQNPDEWAKISVEIIFEK